MAYNDLLSPSIDIEVGEIGKSLVLKEKTGVYSLSNLGGWDEASAVADQPYIADTAVATLTIVDPSTTTYTIDLLANGFPTTNEDFEYEILGTTLGLDNLTKLTTGIYTITYLVSGLGIKGIESVDNEWEETYTKEIFIAPKEECGVGSMGAALTISDLSCGCTTPNTKLSKYVEARAMLDLVYDSVNCGKYNLADFLIQKVQWLINESNCNCS